MVVISVYHKLMLSVYESEFRQFVCLFVFGLVSERLSIISYGVQGLFVLVRLLSLGFAFCFLLFVTCNFPL